MAPSRALQRLAPWSTRPLSVLYRSGQFELQASHGQLRHAHIKGNPASRPAQPARPTQSPHESEQRVLEKPDRYRKPSHPARLPRRSSFAGPPLSEQELEQQKTKQYPHMMPPEGTKLHWFLTNRRIHLVITLGILGSLVSFVWIENFRRSLSRELHDLLPSWSLLPLHPFQCVGRFLQVYKLHVAEVSQETERRRQLSLADAQKRAEYRKAHGIEVGGVPSMLGFKSRSEDEGSVQGIEAGDQGRAHAAAAAAVEGDATAAGPSAREDGEDAGVYHDFEGKKHKTRKWAPFGISLW